MAPFHGLHEASFDGDIQLNLAQDPSYFGQQFAYSAELHLGVNFAPWT